MTLLVLLLMMKAGAQQMTDFTFSHLGQNEGLSNQRIYTIRQTADHALWWSTKEGIDRYNGAYVKHYEIGADSDNTGGMITKLTVGSDSSLIAFDNKGGIYDYDEVQDRFVLRTDLTKTFGHDVILNDIVAGDGGLWLAMREGVYVMGEEHSSRYEVRGARRSAEGRLLQKERKNENSARQLTAVLKGVYTNTFVRLPHRMLLCTRDGVYGVVRGTRYEVRGTRTHDGGAIKVLPYQIESGYYDERHGRVWLGGFHGGLHVMTLGGDGRLTDCPVAGDAISNPVRSICPLNDSVMLAGIDGRGVYKVTRRPSAQGGHVASLLMNAGSGRHGVLHGNGVYAVMCDTWGNIVIGSYSGGIDIARPVGSTPAVFQHVLNNEQSLLNEHVNCVAQWTDGTMAMGTDDGVSLYDARSGQWRHTCRGVVALSLCPTARGTMLVATYGKGVYEISRDGGARQLYSEGDGVLSDSHVYKVYYDRAGGLWMGCLDGGLVYVAGGVAKNYPIKNVLDIIQLPDGRIAVGTADGIYTIDGGDGGKAVRELVYGAGLTGKVNRYVMALYVDGGETLWIGTDGGGAYAYDLRQKTCRQLTTENGLPSNAVVGIVKDNRGRLLLATEQGLSFVSQDNPDRVVDVNYCYGLGREYSARALVNLQNGYVLAGSTTGALTIDPANVDEINYKGRLHLLGVSCSDQDSESFRKRVYEMLGERELHLKYNQRTFDLAFECINLRNQFDIVYQYQVSGGEWSHPSNQQYIRFTNLEPGSHRLVLRSVSRTSRTVIDELEMTIVIAQPWWNSWWMWIVYVGIIALLFYGAWRVYQLHTKYMRLVVSALDTPTTASYTSATASYMSASPDAPADPSAASADDKDDGNDFIDKATKLVVEHLSDSEFSIDRLCREMAMSRTLFYVKLKSYTGKSPQDFIRIIRLERAASMLRGGLSVADAAALTGFDNPKYFSTVFKKYFGVSPSKYE